MNSGASKLSRAERVSWWVRTASRGHNGVKDTRRPPDTRTPLERFRAMRVQGTKVGVFIDDALAAEIVEKLPAESIMPKDDNRGR